MREEREMLFSRGYVLVRELGRGGQACVYLVQGAGHGEYRACKIGDRDRLLEEADLLRTVQHPCFPRYYEFWQWEKRGVLIMEYICGRTLEEWLGDEQIPLEWVENWCLSLGEALHYLHGLPEMWIYRDLKPANVVIRGDGKVKLIDMGCACPRNRVGESIAGTRGYCAPEQMYAPEYVGPYSDFYSLGIILQLLLAHVKKKGIREHWRSFVWKRVCRCLLNVGNCKRKGFLSKKMRF